MNTQLHENLSVKNFSPEVKIKLLAKQSDFCKTFTNPTRLQIINVLIEEIADNNGCQRKVLRELHVTDILHAIKEEFNVELNQTTLSQHIAILKHHNVLIARRDGNNIYYKIANEKIISACCLVREIVLDSLKNTASFSDSLQ